MFRRKNKRAVENTASVHPKTSRTTASVKTFSIRRLDKSAFGWETLSDCASHLCKVTWMSPGVPVDPERGYKMLLQLKTGGWNKMILKVPHNPNYFIILWTVTVTGVRKKSAQYEHVELPHMFSVLVFVIGKKGWVWVGWESPTHTMWKQ